MVKKTCKDHKWIALYYRKYVNGKNYQTWFKVKDKLICQKCEEVKDLK